MPMLPECAAFIIDGVVVNVGALSTENDYEQMLAILADQYDEIRIVSRAGVGWIDTPEGLRAPMPDETTWVWDEENGWWHRPIPRPEGVNYVWDDEVQDWVYTGPSKPTIVEE